MFRRGKKSPRQKQKRIKILQNDYKYVNDIYGYEYKNNSNKSFNNDSDELGSSDDQKELK